ncbi:hypothetical protein H5410_053562 [Solanum commersonii]|uniref:Uncharacterized protein n=1 Tax=Solanum commersonii TaxID=4109 RepID=A0A9J5X582_SOLCO|nr:hypothetical protein H5410_053562 [Solanum commersonii]
MLKTSYMEGPLGQGLVPISKGLARSPLFSLTLWRPPYSTPSCRRSNEEDLRKVDLLECLKKVSTHQIPPIALVSDEETEESMFKKYFETRERITAVKKRLAILDQTEWMLRERIIEVDMKTPSVKRKIAKIDQEIINITKAFAMIPEIERDIKKLNFGNASSTRGNDKTKEGSDNESTGSSPYS